MKKKIVHIDQLNCPECIILSALGVFALGFVACAIFIYFAVGPY